MGVWSKIKGVGKKVLGGAGDIMKYAAPVAAFIPAVGPLAAGAMGFGGGMLGQLNDKDPSLGAGLKQGLISGTTAYGLGKMGGGGKSFLGNAGNAIKGVGNQLLNPYAGGAAGLPGMAAAGMYGSGANPLGLLMGAGSTFMNAQDATRYRGIEDEQIDYAKAQQARQQAMQDKIMGNLNPALNVPNLGGLFEDTSNPFYKPSPAAQSPVTPMGGGPGAGGGIPGIGGGPGIMGDPTIQGPQLPPLPQEEFPQTPGMRLQSLKNRGPKGISARLRM